MIIFVDSICDRIEVWRAGEGLFFSGGEKGWTSQGKYYSKQKDADKGKDKGLPPWPSAHHGQSKHPELEVSASRWRQVQSPSPSSRWSAISSYSVDSQMNSSWHYPYIAQEEKQFYQKHITCHLSHAWLFPSPTPHLSNVSKWWPYFSWGKEHLATSIFPLLNR